ncbi:TIGR02677 family protein [Streptomyces sp. 8N706]|uniref:TIGR02677 family protein n=1 Tax=Streptomyces sp. 8N706 TaxID=3457416 RepID=UPI003FD1B31E
MEPLSRVPPDAFRFTMGDRAGRYGAILQVFGSAHERLETALGVEEIRGRLRSSGPLDALSEEDLSAALRQLEEWGLLDVTHSHAGNPRTAQEYEQGPLQYSPTPLGEAAFAGVRHAPAVLTSAGELQTAALAAVADRLDELHALLEQPASADRRIFGTLQELEAHLEALLDNSGALTRELGSLSRAEGAGLAGLGEVESATVAPAPESPTVAPAREFATVALVQGFLSDLERRGQAVEAAVARVEDRGVGVLHERALRGAALPLVPGEDPGPAWLEGRRARWEDLRAWFRPVDGTPARMRELHDFARRAFLTAPHPLDGTTESHRRSTGAARDFRELARWFAAAPGEEDLHRLWSAAFGLTSSRHAHLCHPDPELIPASESWASSPPVEVSALLRTSGRTERFTRTARVRDIAALKAARAERARHERAELEAAWDMLRTDGPVRLSDFARLGHGVFERLLDLLGRALSSGPDSTGARRGTTGDGRVEVVLRPAPDGGSAVLRTPRGTLEGPDYVVEVRTPGRAAVPAGTTARTEAAG